VEESRFKANRAAWTWFSAKPPSYRKQLVFWVVSAKKPETRIRRLTALIEASAAGQPVGPMSWSRESRAARAEGVDKAR
jgi:uncharacterized protein YdeI (YjbR/CyaY-like superfamily)